jgi:hypothetical protein
MATQTAPPQVTALQAQAAANLFLNDRLPDRFTADQPQLSSTAALWHMPVILAYPFVGSIGEVGEILINADAEAVVSHTPLDEMKEKAQRLYDAHRDEIEAAFS